MDRRHSTPIAVAVCVFIAACGGGGGTDGTPTATQSAAPTSSGSPGTTSSGISPSTKATPSSTSQPAGTTTDTSAGATASPSQTTGGTTTPISDTGSGAPPATTSGGTGTTTPSTGGSTSTTTGGTVTTTSPDTFLASTSRFDTPTAIAFDYPQNAFYIGGAGTIRKLTADGHVTTVAGAYNQRRPNNNTPAGSYDGGRGVALLGQVVGLTIGSNQAIYIADIADPSYSGYLRQVTFDGNVTTLPITANVRGVTADGNGNLYFSDNSRSSVGATDITGSSTRAIGTLRSPRNITVDNAGNLLVVSVPLDFEPLGPHPTSCVLYRLPPDGTPSLVTGKVGTAVGDDTCSSGDGPVGVARFSWAYGVGSGVAVGADGTIFMADGGNNTILRISPAGTVVTIAGLTGVAGSADGTGTEARFNKPTSVALDRNGIVFVTDSGNDTIRRITPSGVVTTVAGAAGQRGNIDTPS